MSYFSRQDIARQALAMLNDIYKQTSNRHRKFSPNSASLIVIDMQKYFTSANSHAFIQATDAILPGICRLIDYFKELRRPIIFTRHLNIAENALMMSKWWRDVIEEQSPLSDIDDRLDISAGRIIKKSQYDAFYATKLNSLFKKANTEQLIITGVMTNLCCETTARAAFARGYEVFFTVDGTATGNEEFHRATLLNLAYGFAQLVLVDEIIGARYNSDE